MTDVAAKIIEKNILNIGITWTSTCNKHQMSQMNVSFIQYYCYIEKLKSDFKLKQFLAFNRQNVLFAGLNETFYY